jgi:MoaA/NifB/PqqE/SkfB family radical SAM enzyme
LSLYLWLVQNENEYESNAGYNVVVVNKDGNIYPCYHLSDYLGNIYKKINLIKKPIRCLLDFCDTPLSILDPHLLKKAVEETKV